MFDELKKDASFNKLISMLVLIIIVLCLTAAYLTGQIRNNTIKNDRLKAEAAAQAEWIKNTDASKNAEILAALPAAATEDNVESQFQQQLNMFSKHNLLIKDVRTKNVPEEKNKFGYIECQMELSGSWESITQCLNELESTYLISISDLSIAADEQLTTKIKYKFYYGGKNNDVKNK